MPVASDNLSYVPNYLNFFFLKKTPLMFSTIYFVCTTNFTSLSGIFPFLFLRMRLESLELLDSLELFYLLNPLLN